MAKPVLAVDIGGSKIAVALVAGGAMLASREVPTPTREGPVAVIDIIKHLANDWTERASIIGIAATGVVRDGRVSAVNRVTLPGWDNYPLQHALSETLGLRTYVLNDAQAAAWGEFRFGAGQNCNSIVFITISTGIGGGIVVEQRLLTGVTGLAGHLGHMRVAPEGPLCGCGRRGCLEQMASGTAIARAAMDKGMTNAREVFQAATGGARWAAEILETSAIYVAHALGDLKMLINPDLVVLGGSVGLAPHFAERITASLNGLGPLYALQVVTAKLEKAAGLVGAADFARVLHAQRGVR